MDFDLQFYLERSGKVAGPVSDDEVRDALREGRLEPGTRVRLAGSDLWLPPAAFATFALRRDSLVPPLRPTEATTSVDAGLGGTGAALRDLLLYWIHESGKTTGPVPGGDLRSAIARGAYPSALAHVEGFGEWSPVAQLFAAEPASAEAAPSSAPLSEARLSKIGRSSASAARFVRCAVCLEQIPMGLETCVECGESCTSAPASSPSSMRGPLSIPDDQPGASWFAMHWRPFVTLGAIAALVFSGVALRYLAPDRFLVTSARPSGARVPHAHGSCAACWNGEACEFSRCVWQKPNDAGAVAKAEEPTIGGPFALPKDFSDALPLDGERFAVALLSGMQVHNARTGGVLSLLTEAPQLKKLFRVGRVIYATSPQRIYVIEADATRLLKTIETGAVVTDVEVGASGRRALASLPSAHAVAILATEYHAEIDRIQFGDDTVGPLGVDETGTRALTTTGQVPLPGYKESQGGAVYAFDPSRLASAQDRVRASMVGNPVDVLMTPDGETSFVVLRAEDALAPLTWLKSGAVRQEARIPTCREPEQIELVRKDRRAIVRCNEGRAIEIFDLTRRELVKHVEFNARVAHLAISPDGEQAIVALPADGAGFVGFVDLTTFDVRLAPVTAEPTHVRYAPDGSVAIVTSDRAKLAWVIR